MRKGGLNSAIPPYSPIDQFIHAGTLLRAKKNQDNLHKITIMPTEWKEWNIPRDPVWAAIFENADFSQFSSLEKICVHGCQWPTTE